MSASKRKCNEHYRQTATLECLLLLLLTGRPKGTPPKRLAVHVRNG